MNNYRVLIFSASYGAGHLRAAEAVMEEIKRQYPGSEVIHMDWGRLISQTLNKIIKDTYLWMIKHAPQLYGKFYYDTGKISSDSTWQRFLSRLMESVFIKYIKSVRPDLVICTYPVVAGVLARLRLKKMLAIPLVTVITDYAVHSQWIHQGVDLYIAACDDVYQDLVARGVPADRIKVTGIPISHKFTVKLNRAETAAKLGLIPDKLTYLIMGGAYGVLKDFKKMIRTFAHLPVPCQVIVVCGRNKRLYRSLDNTIKNAPNPVVRFGFVRNIEELMTVSDAIITKAGGLIVSEALSKQLPLVIYKPIPGQEEQNANFICKIGAGTAIYSLQDLNRIIKSLLVYPEKLEKMRLAAAHALPGRAAEQAVRHIFELLEERGDNSYPTSSAIFSNLSSRR
jgi:processive 1,2-diacylglycerol beta-glucosyltransferase